MDDIIKETPVPTGELKELVEQANKVYLDNFDGKVWFGRCIFLSWYCELGTCKFCFRSTQKHNIKHPEKARRSVPSILAEAMLIKGLGWRIEFLTGGYGIRDDAELVRIVKLVSQILGEKIWINLGEIGTNLLEDFKPYVGGIVSSIETVEPKLHKEVCPDKPIEPYIEMIKKAKDMGFKQSMTVIIGLGEKKEDFELLNDFLNEHKFDRITVYALRPVKNSPYEKGPKPEDVAWWVSKIRINHPTIEIIVGSAQYRIPELSLMLEAGANAITKLPATNIFNTKKGLEVENEVKKANRDFLSKFTSEDIDEEQDWEGMLDNVDLTEDEKIEVLTTLEFYLKKMKKQRKELVE